MTSEREVVMTLRKMVVALFCAVIVLTAPAGVWAQKAPEASGPAAVDQRALDILKKMSDTLSGAKTVSFQARSMVPVKAPGGIWINLYGTSKVVMEGHGKLYASTGGDLAAHDFYYDGKTVTMYSPDKNLYAVKEAPATVDEMIEQAYKEDGKSFPYADILVSEPYSVLTEGLTAAHYVGQSTIRPLAGSGGVRTDHLAFSNKGVEWQIWIDVNDHLPRLVVATYLDDLREPSYSVEFGDWKLDETVSADTFVFNNTTKAGKVEFRSPFKARQVGPPAAAANR